MSSKSSKSSSSAHKLSSRKSAHNAPATEKSSGSAGKGLASVKETADQKMQGAFKGVLQTTWLAFTPDDKAFGANGKVRAPTLADPRTLALPGALLQLTADAKSRKIVDEIPVNSLWKISSSAVGYERKLRDAGALLQNALDANGGDARHEVAYASIARMVTTANQIAEALAQDAPPGNKQLGNNVFMIVVGMLCPSPKNLATLISVLHKHDGTAEKEARTTKSLQGLMQKMSKEELDRLYEKIHTGSGGADDAAAAADSADSADSAGDDDDDDDESAAEEDSDSD
jgi:hypothetical protein